MSVTRRGFLKALGLAPAVAAVPALAAQATPPAEFANALKYGAAADAPGTMTSRDVQSAMDEFADRITASEIVRREIERNVQCHYISAYDAWRIATFYGTWVYYELWGDEPARIGVSAFVDRAIARRATHT